MRKPYILALAAVPVLLLPFLAQPSGAQQAKRGAPGIAAARRAMPCILRALVAAGVTAEQKAQMKAIRERYAPEFKAIRESDLPPAEKRAKAVEVAKRARAEAMSVLTAEQQAAVREFMKKNCWRRPAPGPGQHPALKGCLLKALDAAGVTAEQKAQMKAIREKYAPQFRAIRESDMTPAEKRAKAAELAKQARTEAMSVLSADQQAAVRDYVRKNCAPGAARRPFAPPAR